MAALSQVANRSRGDELMNGQRLYGLDAEVHRHIQSKRDPHLERQLAQWVAAATGEKVDMSDPIESFRSGIILCKLANAIRPNIIAKCNSRPIALLEMENIGFYLKACWMLGVPSAELFVTSDLYLRKSEPQVFLNLLSLARIAESTPSYRGPTMKSLGFKIAGRPVEKRTTQWSGVIQDKGRLFVTDLEAQEQQQQQQSNSAVEALSSRPLTKQLSDSATPVTPPQLAQPNYGTLSKAPTSTHPSPELQAVKILERQLDDERKRAQLATQEIKRLKKELEIVQSDPSAQKGGSASERTGTAVDSHSLYEKIKMLELKKEQELEAVRSAFELKIREERRKWEEEAEQVRADLINDLNYWKTEAESKDIRLRAHKADTGVSEEWEQRMAERRTREIELAQRKEAAAKALLEREKKKAEQDKAEIERLTMQLQALTLKFNELTEKNHPTHQEMKQPEEKNLSSRTLQIAKQQEAFFDQGIFERHRKNTILAQPAEGHVPGGASPRNKITTLRWEANVEQAPELIEALNECVQAVLYSSTEVHFSDIMQLNELFKTDYGRRQFAFALEQTMKQLPSKCLSSDAFDMMLYLMTRMLVEAESNGDKDYIALSSLMKAASTLYRMDRGMPSYLQEFVKDFSIWKNVDFWEEYFLHELIKKRKKKSGAETVDSDDAILAAGLLSPFVSTMVQWDIPTDVSEKFIHSASDRFSLNSTTVKDALNALAVASAKKTTSTDPHDAKDKTNIKGHQEKIKKKKKSKKPKDEAHEEKPGGVIKSFQVPQAIMDREKRMEEVRLKHKTEHQVNHHAAKQPKDNSNKKEKKDKKKKKEMLENEPKDNSPISTHKKTTNNDQGKGEKREEKKKKQAAKEESDDKRRSRSKTEVPLPHKPASVSPTPLFFGRS